MTLDQVKAARPTFDYDPLYGARTGAWTTDMFIEAMYRDLSKEKTSRAGSRRRQKTMSRYRDFSKSLILIFHCRCAFALDAARAQAAPVRRARRGRGDSKIPATAKAAAVIDLTGYWVAIVNEDWRWRMMTPAKGDYSSLPLNAEGHRVADTWDPEKDERGWQSVPGLWRRQHHAHPGAPAYHLGG